jgi:hypothetical protein
MAMRQSRKDTSHPRQLTTADFTARYKAEKILQRQRYGAAFALWRTCTGRRCRRQRACTGEASACLKRALAAVPQAAQWQARQQILAATPQNIGAPERAARQCMPIDLYIETAAQAVADYLARFRPKPRRGAG